MTYELFWKAIYNNGTEINQYNEDGTVNKYIDIVRTGLVQFVIYNGDKSVLVVHLDSNKNLIFRRRVAMKLISSKQEVVYLAGWQENKNGINIQQISFIFEDGHIEVVDGFKKDHKWFRPIIFLEDEKLWVIQQSML